MSAAFACLNNVSVGTAPNVRNLGIMKEHQALILMAALPQKWEHLIPISCQGHDLGDLDVSVVRDVLKCSTRTRPIEVNTRTTRRTRQISCLP